MQTVSANLQAELDKGPLEPRILIDLVELYASDYVPGVDGFDPADAIETFASVELTWNGIAYRRELQAGGGRGDITRNMGEKTNSVTLNFSNISRYMATLAQTQVLEGLFCVIRCVCPTVTDDSIVLFVGRCDKPSDIDKGSFTMSARQDFGNINQELPPRRFTAEDPEGRTPSDPLYEGFRLTALSGSFSVPVTTASTSFFGRLFGRTKTSNETRQWSSMDATPYGSVLPMDFGRCQREGIPIQFADIGYSLIGVWAIDEGRIDEIWNVKLQDDRFELATIEYHFGDPGGTGTNATDTSGPIKQGYLSRTAYIVLSIRGSEGDTVDEAPVVTMLIRGTQVPLPNTSGVFGASGWTDNGVYISRFILTDPRLVGIDSGFMEDDVNYQTGLHCDEPLIDDTTSELIPIPAPDIPEAGTGFVRLRSTGLINPRRVLFYDLGDTSIIPETVDGPYEPFDPLDPPTLFTPQRLLRKRYTTNVPITDSIKAVDFLYKVIFPSFKGYLRVNKRGKYEIRSEQATDHSYLRAATAVGATSITVQDVTPWKSGELLTGRLLLGFNQLTSEVRDITAAVYSADGNSITLTAGDTGGVVATASGATLSGGSTTVQASGTVTISGTPGPGDTVTVTINGVEVSYTLSAEDTTSTVASLLASWINATGRLKPYIRAFWDVGSPTVVTIKCLYGALTVDSALLKVHAGPIADPMVAPTVAASSGGSLPAGTWMLAYSNANSIGSTALTPLASVVVTADQKIDVSGLPALPAGITARNFFLSDQADSINLKFSVQRTNAADFSITDFPDGSAAVPPSFNSTGEELMRVAMSFATNSQDVYPAWSPNTTVLLGDTYLPTVPNGHKYEVTTGGVTGSTEPSPWPLGGTPIPVVPTDIAGCKLWLKADSLALSNNDPVTTWADQSGNGNDATQATAGFKPLYKTAILNGKPALLFDGSDDHLATAAFTLNQPYSTFIVFRPTNVTPLSYINDGLSINTNGLLITGGSLKMYQGNIDANLYTAGRSVSDNTDYIHSGLINGASTKTYLDGDTELTGDPGSGNPGGWTIGSTATGTVPFSGYIAEIIIYNSVLTALQRKQVETYLGDKYGITVANYEYISSGSDVTSGTAVFTEDGATVLGQAGLTRANIVKDSYKWPKGSTQSSVNQSKGEYVDSTNDFAKTPIRVNDKPHQLQVKKIYPHEINLAAVDNLHQSLRLLNADLAKHREGDWFNSLSTGPNGLVLEEGDVICASDDSGGLINVVTRIEELRIKPNHNVEINQGRKYSTNMFSDEVGAQTITLPSTLKFSVTADSIAEFIDNFPIRDADGLTPGFYIAVSRDLSIEGDWRAWALYANYGDGYVKIAEGDIPAIMGVSTTTLPSVSDPTLWDDVNSHTFTLHYGPPAPFPNPFATVTKTELSQNQRRNLFLIGNEYVQAATVVDNGNQSYTISNLLRGRFGTDTPQFLTHGADERVVYLDGSEALIPIDPVRLNTAYDYKAVTVNQDVADAGATPFTWAGGTVRPLAPVHITGIRDAANNLFVEWQERSRLGQGMSPNSDVPLAEEIKKFKVDWYSGATLISTYYVTAQAGIVPFILDRTNTTAGVPDSLGARFVTEQKLDPDLSYVEGTIDMGALSQSVGLVDGTMTATVDGDDISWSSDLIVTATVNSVTGLGVIEAGVLKYSQGVAYTDPFARVRVALIDGRVHYYLNPTGTDDVPLFVSSRTDLISRELHGYFFDADGTITDRKIRRKKAYFLYTADQQTDDGFTPGDPLKVRIAQLSAIVGAGDYQEATI